MFKKYRDKKLDKKNDEKSSMQEIVDYDNQDTTRSLMKELANYKPQALDEERRLKEKVIRKTKKDLAQMVAMYGVVGLGLAVIYFISPSNLPIYQLVAIVLLYFIFTYFSQKRLSAQIMDETTSCVECICVSGDTSVMNIKVPRMSSEYIFVDGNGQQYTFKFSKSNIKENIKYILCIDKSQHCIYNTVSAN